MSHTHDHSHGPAHSHSHGHGDGHDFSKANAEHFDKTAAQYDEEAKIDVVTRIVEKIRGAYSFDPERTSMLDFACGTGSCLYLLYLLLRTDTICIGLVSRMLEPYTRKIVGVDISQGMVDVYNARMAERGVSSERALAAVRDVLKEPFQTGWQTYDVIVVCIHLLFLT
jgi:2-polyprenyl-3-methyl-5-hydroxy-6-metoxy-1,4-benzoquinol methylase